MIVLNIILELEEKIWIREVRDNKIIYSGCKYLYK